MSDATYKDLRTGSVWVHKKTKRRAVLHYGLHLHDERPPPDPGTLTVGYRYEVAKDGARSVQSCNVRADNFLRAFKRSVWPGKR